LERSHTTAYGGASPKAMGGLARYLKIFMYKVYIIQSQKNSKYYIGMALNLENRLKHHNSGATKSTKPGRPWKIVHYENCCDKKTAWLREKQIKSYKGGVAFKKLFKLTGEIA